MTIKFPSIEQFRNVIKHVEHTTRYDGIDETGKVKYVLRDLPTLTFTGSVKLHGSNGGVRVEPDGNIVFQSRERDLSLTSDNAGFCLWGESKKELFGLLTAMVNFVDDVVVIFGEWCGGNIQSGVALSGLPKMFVIFDILSIDDNGIRYWKDSVALSDTELKYFNDNQIYFKQQFPSFSIDIDFNNPALVQNKLVEITEQVETECPVGKYFGVSGVGEGVVWRTVFNGEPVRFKVKGEKHSASKVKTLAAVDVEKINGIKEFVQSVVTESRLNQGLGYLKEMQLEPIDKNVGTFLKWVVGDVMKEETDTIVANQLDMKLVPKEISNIARKWYFEQI